MSDLKKLAHKDLLTYDTFRMWVAGLPNDYVFLDGTTRTGSCPVAKFARDGLGWRRAWAGATSREDGFVCPGDGEAFHTPWIGRFIMEFDFATTDRCDGTGLTAAELRARLPGLQP